jgi:hypothetical protein
MKIVEVRNGVHGKPRKLSVADKRQQWKITAGLTDEKQQAIEKEKAKEAY